MCMVWSNFWFLLVTIKMIDSVICDHVTLTGIRGTEKPGTLTKMGPNKPYPEVTASLSQTNQH